MTVVDVVIILLILFGGFIGMKRGFTRQLVDTVGVIVAIILAFLLRGYVSNLFYKFMPFFEFGGRFEGITAMNILLYEVIAFILILCLLSGILTFLRKSTNVFEKMLNATIILGIPSKILGFIVGIINNFIYVFIVLYVLSLPMLGFTFISEAKVTTSILESTPILSHFCNGSVQVFEEMHDLMEEYRTGEDREALNQKTLLLFIEHDVTDKETINELIKNEKLENATVIE